MPLLCFSWCSRSKPSPKNTSSQTQIVAAQVIHNNQMTSLCQALPDDIQANLSPELRQALDKKFTKPLEMLGIAPYMPNQQRKFGLFILQELGIDTTTTTAGKKNLQDTLARIHQIKPSDLFDKWMINQALPAFSYVGLLNESQQNFLGKAAGLALDAQITKMALDSNNTLSDLQEFTHWVIGEVDPSNSDHSIYHPHADFEKELIENIENIGKNGLYNQWLQEKQGLLLSHSPRPQ